MRSVQYGRAARALHGHKPALRKRPGHFLQGRARAFQSMVGGGMDVAKAASLAGLLRASRGFTA